MTWTRHRLRPALLAHEIGVRNRCATDRHEPRTYNPLYDVTYCACGRFTHPGNVGRYPTPHETCEATQGRTDHALVCPIHQEAS